MTEEIRVEQARPAEQAAALRLVFQHLDEAVRDDRVANALRLLERGELDPAGLLVVRRRSIIGAIVCAPMPGATGLLWPPQTTVQTAPQPIEDALMHRAAAWLRRRGAKFGQSLLSPEETHLAPVLERNGFPHITDLWYLQHDLDLSLNEEEESEPLRYEPYSEKLASQFRRTLMRTYEGTQDCPEINGMRTADEILDSHRTQGEFDPSRWWLTVDNGQPLGIVLLTVVPEFDAWDVSYIGVVPEARRRGLGQRMMWMALRAASAAKAGQMTLSVDARNSPARELYARLGFRSTESRQVFLALWR